MKTLLAVLALCVSTASSAVVVRDVYHYDASAGVAVNVEQNPRMKIFAQARFAISVDGVPMVCLDQYVANDNGKFARCEDDNDRNMWMPISDPRILPGWKADKYQITQGRYYRAVTIFFKKQ